MPGIKRYIPEKLLRAAKRFYERDVITAETFIIGFNGDLYGKNVTVSFEEYLREEKKFTSVEELRAAIEKDLEKVIEKA